MSDIQSGAVGDNGDSLTDEEAKAIRSLERLAKRWPRSITLISMGGSLYVVHTADERMGAPGNIERAEAVLTGITGIPNDGGDW
jgi:hypothetical protein